jgi:hypothetical protein
VFVVDSDNDAVFRIVARLTSDVSSPVLKIARSRPLSIPELPPVDSFRSQFSAIIPGTEN